MRWKPHQPQQAVVAGIETEQALVAANRELINRFEKKIQAALARIWGENVQIGDDCGNKNGDTEEKSR